MDLTDLSQLKSLLQKHKLWANKNLGQNFLVSRKSLEKIVAAADLHKDDLVVEVGPGPGVLTCELLPLVQKVIAVELDREIVPVLTETTASYRNLELKREDILKFIPPSEDYKIVANIPYYLTSKLLRHFLEEVENKPSLMVMLTQKEVAEKILDKKMNLLALSVRVYAEAEIVAEIPAKHFYPAPKVDSAILRLKVYDKPAIKSKPKEFFRIAKAGFIGKRKQLKNTLANIGIPTEKTKEALVSLGYTEQARPEELSLAHWDELVQLLAS